MRRLTTPLAALFLLSSPAWGQPLANPVDWATGTGSGDVPICNPRPANYTGASWFVAYDTLSQGLVTVTKPDGTTVDIDTLAGKAMRRTYGIKAVVSTTGGKTSVAYGGFDGTSSSSGDDPKVGDAYAGVLVGVPIGSTGVWKSVTKRQTQGLIWFTINGVTSNSSVMSPPGG